MPAVFIRLFIRRMMKHSISGTKRLESLADCAPIYEEFEGFDEDISNCKSFDELPEACKKYIARLVRFYGYG